MVRGPEFLELFNELKTYMHLMFLLTLPHLPLMQTLMMSVMSHFPVPGHMLGTQRLLTIIKRANGTF